MDIADEKKGVEIFCCYAREDQPLLLKLKTHLALLEREGSLNIWHDMDISPGTEWEEEINKHLNTAHIILLLISPDFMASEYCYSKEMKQAMERHERGEACVIPILLRPGIWQKATLAKLQVLPNNAQAVTEWKNRDKAFFAVAQGIEQVAKEQLTKLSITSSGSGQEESDTNTSHYSGKYTIKNDGPTQGQVVGEHVYVTMYFGNSQEEHESPLGGSGNKSDHSQVSHYPSSEPPQSKIDATRLPLKSRDGTVQRDWDGAPDVPVFFGRTKELISLEQWVNKDRCRLVALVGMKGVGKTKLSLKLGRGGIGKTDLSLKLAREIEERFDYVIWRRLLNAPKVSEILTDLIKFLSNQQEVHIPDTVSGQIVRLLHYLCQSRCLVILDNVEMILQGGKHAGQYHPDYEEYGQLFEQIAEFPHQSCILLTSREKVPEIARLESKTGPVRSLEVRGLNVADGQKIFAQMGSFSGSKEDWKQLNHLYNGNPLALELAARHIQEVFFGSISQFLRDGKPTFADLRSLLDWHFNRLSGFHKEVMYWFAINREPTSLSELKEDLLLSVSKEQISSTLYSLQRLIPLEKSAHSFTLQPVLIEYMTERFIEQIVEEVRNGEMHLFNTHALLKTSVSDYVRDIQRRLILKAISEKLLEIYGNRERLEARLKDMLPLLREHFRFSSGYAGGNALNLLCSLKVDLRGYNFSSLAVWQAYLRGVNVQEVNFAHANLAKSVFTDTFGSVLSVALSPCGDLLAAGTTPNEIRFWDIASGLPLQTLRGHSDWVTSVAFSPDGKTLASGSYDRTVRLWEVSSGKSLSILHGHVYEVTSVAFSPDGKTLASGSEDRTVRLWEVSSGKSLSILHDHSDRVLSVVFSPDGKTLASGSEDRTVRLWEVGSGKSLNILHDHAGQVRSVAFSPDGRTLASGSDAQTVCLWEVSSGKLFNTLQGYANAVNSVALSPDGKILASGSEDQTVRLWEVSSGKLLNILRNHASPVWSVAFSPDGRTLASGNNDQTVRLWEVSSGQCLNTLRNHASPVWPVAFSPDGRTLASGSYDQTVRLWEVSSGKLLNTLHGHSNYWVTSVAFSPDGRTLASGSYDQTVRLWEVSSGQCLNVLQGHTNMVTSVAFSPDGKTLASGSSDGTINLWDSQTSACLRTLRSDRPYERMNITQVQGLTEAQKAILRLLGAIEEDGQS